MADEPERAEIILLDEPDTATREELAAKLEHLPGIVSAYYSGEQPDRLVVHYETDHFSHLTLLDTVRGHELRAELAS